MYDLQVNTAGISHNKVISALLLHARVFQVRWSRYNPYYLEPEVRKEAYSRPETELSAEEKEQRKLKALRPIKAATNSVTSSVFNDPAIRFD